MSNEKMQWLILGLMVVLFVGFGSFVMRQEEQIDRLSNALASLSGDVQGLSQRAAVPVTTTPSSTVVTPEAQPVATGTSSRGSEIFDPTKTKVGDIIAGLKVVSMGPVQGITRPMAQDNVSASFMGQVTVAGDYDIATDAMSGTEKACFTISQPPDLYKLPVLIGEDDQEPRFCFTNIEKVKQDLGSTAMRGHATITIDQYQLNYASAEVTNRARLVTVVSKH